MFNTGRTLFGFIYDFISFRLSGDNCFFFFFSFCPSLVFNLSEFLLLFYDEVPLFLVLNLSANLS